MLFKPSKIIGNLSTIRWIGSYTLLSFLISLQPVYAGTLFCPQGKLGSGGNYDPSISKCFRGATVDKVYQFCEKGSLGSGGFFDPSISKCFRGATVDKVYQFCEKGSLGSGGFFDPSISKCFRGATVDKVYQFCEKGSLGSGGFFDPSISKCFRGAVVNKDMFYCKQQGSKSGYRFYYPADLPTGSVCQDSNEGVLEVSGEVFLIRGGKKIPLKRGFDIQEGDKVQTGATGKVAFKLSDGSEIRLSSSTNFTVDKYSYNNSCSTSNDFNVCGRVYSLLKGLFVYTSGLMDKHSEKNVDFKTDIASLGVRGTKFGMAQVINNAHGVNPGNYVKVYKGEIYLHNSAGSIDVFAGKVAYVANDKSRPIIIDNPPGIFSK